MVLEPVTVDEMMQVLNKEIEWCNENPDPAFHAEYRKGFVNGLIQAKYLISEASKAGKRRERRLMEREQANPVTDEEVNEVESAFQLEKKYPGMLKWGRIRKCDVCGNPPAALCFDGVRRCLSCINRVFPEGVRSDV